MTKIGFIGLGHMGQPMAKNLLAAGHHLIVFDVVRQAMDVLVNQGAKAADSLLQLISEADIIFTMLQTSQQVKDICLNEQEGIFKFAKKGLLFIDSSSIEISTTRELHELATNRGVAMLDAPVSGGVLGAQEARLTFMVGGDQGHFQKALPILEKLGKKIIHAGGPGNGQAAKICNNLILGISMIAVSEGFSLAQKLGLSAKDFFEISSNASGQCWSMTSYCPVPGLVPTSPANREYEPGFTAKMMLKDLRLAQHAAENYNAGIPLGAEAAELYSLFVNQGHGGLDFSAIIKMLAGIETYNSTDV